MKTLLPVLALIAAPALLWAGGGAETTVDTWDVVPNVSTVIVSLDIADVVVRGNYPGPGIETRITKTASVRDQVTVEASATSGEEGLLIQFTTNYVDPDSQSLRFRLFDELSVEVLVPSGIDVQVRSGAGRVTVENLDASVTVNAGAGRVRLSGVRGAVRVFAGAGGIVASDLTLTGPSSFSSGAGGVRIQIDEGREFLTGASSGLGPVRVR
jgi:hypothetical protein